MKPILEVIPDQDWARRTAQRFAAFVKDKPDARVCLPTGSTVEPFYEKMARSADLKHLTIYLLDEFGGLPPGDPGRCESMIHGHLLDRVPQAPTINLPDVDADDLGGECARYESLIDDGGLDLAILGLGANGHIGMNEPGSTIDSTTNVMELARTTTEHAAEYGATASPTWGITIGMRSLLKAREVWLMVTGEHKREILRRTLNEEIGPDLPATFLRDHPNCMVFADESAAG